LGLRGPRVVHDAEVNDGVDRLRAEHVLELLAPYIELLVAHILRLVWKRTPVHTDDASLTMKHSNDVLAEPTTSARDQNRACATHRRMREPAHGGGSRIAERAVRDDHGALWGPARSIAKRCVGTGAESFIMPRPPWGPAWSIAKRCVGRGGGMG